MSKSQFLQKLDIASLCCQRSKCHLFNYCCVVQHDVGHDGDFDPFTENDLHTVFIHYDASSQSAARRIASQLIDVFLGRLGVVLANV